MLNKVQIELLSSIFNATEIKEYIDNNYYDFLIFDAKEKEHKVYIRQHSWFSSFSIIGGAK